MSLAGWHSIWWETDAVWFIFAPQFHRMLLYVKPGYQNLKNPPSSSVLKFPPADWSRNRCYSNNTYSSVLEMFLLVVVEASLEATNTQSASPRLFLSLAVNGLNATFKHSPSLCDLPSLLRLFPSLASMQLTDSSQTRMFASASHIRGRFLIKMQICFKQKYCRPLVWAFTFKSISPTLVFKGSYVFSVWMKGFLTGCVAFFFFKDSHW